MVSTNPPQAGTRRLPALVLLACVVLGGSSCDDARRDTFVPQVRLVDRRAQTPQSPAFDTRYAELLDDARPVFSASVPVPLRDVRCPWGKRCSAPVPDAVAGEPWLALGIPREGRRAADDDAPASPDTAWRLLETPEGGVLDVPSGLGPQLRQRLVVRALRPPAARDVTTAPVDVPPGATLRFASGVEPAAWAVDSAPLGMSVTALVRDGPAQGLYRRRLDPSRVEDDRAWRDVEIPLDAFAGRAVRFRFASRPVEADDPRPSLPVWGDPTIWAPRAADARPSVVLVSLDTLRARSTSAYGYGRDTTPYLTELARSGTLFERAFTTYVNTLGSHMSLFTGLYPASHGVLFLTHTLPAERPTLAEALRAAGYDTAAVTENGFLEGALGFRRGFSTWFENEKHLNSGDAPETFRRALAWARSREPTPFFLFVHTYAVHLPYAPPAGYETLFESGRPAADQPFPEREQLRYEQEIRAVDDQMRSFVARLSEVVPASRLLLVVTADHGEEFDERGQMTHVQLYDEVMHVPLVLRWDGVVDAGARPDVLVSLTDVAPTVLDLLGLPTLPDVDGVSLAAIARGDAPTIERDVLFAQSVPYGLKGNKWHFVARAADAKCILAQDDEVECFDLVEDPGERRPRAPGSSARLAEVHRRAEEYRTRAQPAIAARAGHSFADDLRAVDAATERKLRALGYAQ